MAVARRLAEGARGAQQDHRRLACRLGKPRHRPFPAPLLEEIPVRQAGTRRIREAKRQVNAGKEWIKVRTENLSMFRNPGKEELVVVTFEQDYRSNNLSNQMKKRQYWIREDGNWKIIYEGAA